MQKRHIGSTWNRKAQKSNAMLYFNVHCLVTCLNLDCRHMNGEQAEKVEHGLGFAVTLKDSSTPSNAL